MSFPVSSLRPSLGCTDVGARQEMGMEQAMWMVQKQQEALIAASWQAPLAQGYLHWAAEGGALDASNQSCDREAK